MGWDQEYCVESVSSFLKRLVGIEPDFVSNEVKRRMDALNLSVVKIEDVDDIDDYYGSGGVKRRITLSDGRVFIHKFVYSVRSDDWGRDEYEFKGEDEQVEVVRKDLLDDVNED